MERLSVWKGEVCVVALVSNAEGGDEGFEGTKMQTVEMLEETCARPAGEVPRLVVWVVSREVVEAVWIRRRMVTALRLVYVIGGGERGEELSSLYRISK